MCRLQTDSAALSVNGATGGSTHTDSQTALMAWTCSGLNFLAPWVSGEMRKARSASPDGGDKVALRRIGPGAGEAHGAWRSQVPGFLVNVLHAASIMAPALLAGYS
jgi:hypothetical protein